MSLSYIMQQIERGQCCVDIHLFVIKREAAHVVFEKQDLFYLAIWIPEKENL